VKLIGLGARDSLRLEAGFAFTDTTSTRRRSPVEAALAWSIGKRRREEGGFPGAERVQRELREGPLACASGSSRTAARRRARAPRSSRRTCDHRQGHRPGGSGRA
jgi:aminomethyltransferase